MILTDEQRELVSLDCKHCEFHGPPTLMRAETSQINQLGAYCGRCKRFLQWVKQSGAWLTLESSQSTVGPSVPDTQTDREGVWVDVIKEMGQFCHDQAESMGWHENRRSTLERAMLVVTELAELSESARHGTLSAPSDHITEFTQAEEEWADVLVRVFDHSPDDGVTSERLGQAFVAKLAFNRTRGHKHGGKTI